MRKGDKSGYELPAFIQGLGADSMHEKMLRVAAVPLRTNVPWTYAPGGGRRTFPGQKRGPRSFHPCSILPHIRDTRSKMERPGGRPITRSGSRPGNLQCSKTILGNKIWDIAPGKDASWLLPGTILASFGDSR